MSRVKISYRGKEILINAEECSLLGKFRGLMFRSSSTSPLLFSFSGKRRIALHSMFVFFDFLVIWLDEKNNAIGFRIAEPFEPLILPPKKCSRIIEIPIHSGNRKEIEFFVGKQKV